VNFERPGSAGDLLGRYLGREVSPVEVVTEALQRIEALDGGIGAFRAIFADRALGEAADRAKALRDGEPAGPLHGVPVAVKELIDVEGAPGTYGSRALVGRVHTRDAAAVTRLCAAGAIVIGTTRSHEFGWGITTQHELDGGTRNPWDSARVPGGSSGGSAAAVAAGMVPLALGSDTGGSIRIPASYCGVAGLKPTYGSISSEGVVPLAPSLDHVGPIAARIEDLWRAWHVLADRHPDRRGRGPGWMLPLEKIRGLRVGIAPELNDPPLNPSVQARFHAALAVLSQSGCPVMVVALGSAAHLRSTFATIQMVEAFHSHSRVIGTYPSRAADYGTDVRGRLEAAAKVGLVEYLDARDAARAARLRFEHALATVDVLLTPVAAGGPSTVDRPEVVEHLGRTVEFRDLVMNYTTPQNLTGLPACSVAVGLDDEGLPVGVQLTAAAGREATVLLVAAVLQNALPLPPVPISACAAAKTDLASPPIR